MSERRCKLLVIDESPEARDTYRRALCREDDAFELIEAATGQQGLALCRATAPDGVLLGQRLPDMDALQFLAELSGGQAEPPVPVVVVAEPGGEPSEAATMRAGAYGHLARGAPAADLRRAVRTAMERHQRLPDRSLRVLIIDDRPEDRGAYRRWLSRGPERFEFQEAETGEEGLALCRSFKPDCVLLDYHLPDTDGLEVLTTLVREGDSRFAVLMLTGQGNEAVAVRAIKAGAEDYLVKGAALEALPQAVRVAIEKVALRRRLEEQRQALERSRNQAQVTLASIGDAVIVTDPVGHVTFLNPVAEALTGWRSDEARGRPLVEVFTILHEQSRRPVDNPALRALREGKIVGLANHTLLRSRDGALRPIDDSAAPIRDEAGEVFGAVLVFRDISERHRLEDELQRKVAELALAHQRKDEFLAMLAHELRNPLTPIKNAIFVLKQAAGDPQVVDRMHEIIARQTGHLARLVDDLLDVSRITQGKVVLKPERIDLAQLVRECVTDHVTQFERARLTLRADTPQVPVWIRGDATRIAQIVENFLSNALKFTNPGDEVIATVRATDAAAELSVRDSGIGIEPDVLPTVFEVFSQADKSLDRSPGGLGLGLAIVRGLVHLHGGTVSARSEGPGKGTEMFVSLPRTQEPLALTQPERTPRSPGRRQRVLVIEDNHDSADSLRLLLEVSGYEVRLAHTGTEGVRVATEWLPDAIVCDIGLPGMDGYTVARRLRNEPSTARVRLLALTGYGRQEDVGEARAAGFDEHLMKPADPERLLGLLGAVDGGPP